MFGEEFGSVVICYRDGLDTHMSLSIHLDERDPLDQILKTRALAIDRGLL